MKAVVLAGGFNTRLRPLSCTRPKILFPILNKPLLQWTLERLAQNNINNIILAVFHQTEGHIKQHRIPKHGLNITYSHDPLRKPLGTAGSIKKAEKQIGHNAPFLALNGDIFADIDYTQMLKQHQKNNCTATIALHKVQDPTRYGVAKLSKNNQITGFIEKPAPGTAPSNLINAGAYILSPKIFKHIPPQQTVSIEHEIFPKLAQQKELYGYIHNGLWTDIGKPEDYLQLNKTMLDNVKTQPKYKTKGNVQIKNPVAFAKNVTIGNQSTIGPYTVLGKRVTIGNNVNIKNSIILAETQIADHAEIHDAIIGEGVHIGKKTHIRKGCIIGDHARIKDNITLPPETSICPATEVTENSQSTNCKQP